MRFITIKTRVTIYFTLMMVLVVALVLIFMLIVGNRVLTNNAETTLLDVVHDNIDDVEYKNGYLDLDELSLYRHNVYILVYDEGREPAVVERDYLPAAVGPRAAEPGPALVQLAVVEADIAFEAHR